MKRAAGWLFATLLLAACTAGSGAPKDARVEGPQEASVVDVADLGAAEHSTAADGVGTQDAGPGPDQGATDSGSTLITPDTPPASTVTFKVHVQKQVKAISRHIYGINGASFSGRQQHVTLTRSGGNRLTAYNWENNASNAGTDWQNQNDDFLGGGNTAGEVARSVVAAAQTNGASAIITVPIAGYVAADKNGGGDVNQTPNYLQVRFRQSKPTKGAAFALTPDLNDAFVYQDEFVNFIENTFPQAHADPQRTIFYQLDNEPALWASTHPRIHSAPVTYAELMQKTRDYAAAIKAVAPKALVFGPVLYGWQAYVDLQNASDANGRDFLEHYLAQLKVFEGATGKRLVDVLDIHWYPEAEGGGQRISSDSTDPAVAAARLQAPRSLWDTTYTEASWISQWSTTGPIYLIPRLRAKIAAHYPGTKIAITEYYYGGGDHISGGLAQADVLGIFGREGVFAATLWRLGSTQHGFIYGAFELFRSYDGQGGSFGDTSVEATNSDDAKASVYASLDAGKPQRMVLLCLNKTGTALTAGLSITHTVLFKQAKVYRLTSASAQPQPAPAITLTLNNALQLTMPAYSASVLVLTP